MIAQLRSLTAAGMLVAATLAGFGAQAQTTVVIGTGTTAGSTNVLLSTSTTTNKYSRTLSIYTAAELQAAGARAGSITRIGWYKDGTGEYPTTDAQMTILLKSTTAAALPGDPVTWATEAATATQVYSNNALSLPTGTGWKDFTLSAPFTWNGTDNVEVLVDWFRNSAPTGNINWRYTAVTTASGLHATQVNANSIPTVRLAPNRPNIQFTMTIANATRGGRQVNNWATVAPNPFEQQLTVRLLQPGSQPVAATLTDALGRVQLRQTLTARAEQTLALPAALARGVYFLTLSNGAQQQTLRVVRQ
ncbi:T9SS type A sorting domain-containing protein [Hymenobacter gummosus]|uniref:T9SS type A sorting domain-containing protein n=1 Tax=Hymenobacter gummosus TaxID=1776032 RepID=A0A431U9Q4_9BACT|nr:T9SS type A sorting domain-containing protein [Hymenobacter gummosus]RTQ53768.1 T9SS type A sorting domain-containing protein [Hymenobacter gummosus]